MFSTKKKVLATISAMIVIAVLVLVGRCADSKWDTFIPDLIVGVISAAVIGFVIFAMQHRSDNQRVREAEVSACYSRLLDALTPLRIFNPMTDDAVTVSVVRTRMLQLYEAVDQDGSNLVFANWLEAEGQLCLHRAMESMNAIEALPNRDDRNAVFEAIAPFGQWVAEFSNNIRFWRSGKMTQKQMVEQATIIESGLRDAGVWREDDMPWRSN